MEYNTARPKLVLKEYGRHVQKIVQNCVATADPVRRNQFAREIIELMGQLNPQLRHIEDFRHKLWDQLFIISDFKLEVDAPYPIVKREELYKKPERLPYPQSKIRFKHYGKYVERLVEKCIATEDPEKQAAFTQCIGNFMKMVYQNWSKEEVNDLTIKNDLLILSDGKLQITEDQDISSLARANKFKPAHLMNNGNGNRKKRHNRNKIFRKRR
ncbi:MAG: DUF4290 domain-containing protein [Chitinophagales bacterium]|nr:DUF4290 domain-containing protein [Chitinophagales bacterium]MDW8420108.1 DUF4290 domain-containing protein [Chitinophagales bacterium]